MPKRIDGNQNEIVNALRRAGCTVQILSAVGKGCPDLIVGHHAENFLFELKTEKGKLTPDEARWHEDWDGQVAIVLSAEDALRVVGLVD